MTYFTEEDPAILLQEQGGQNHVRRRFGTINMRCYINFIVRRLTFSFLFCVPDVAQDEGMVQVEDGGTLMRSSEEINGHDVSTSGMDDCGKGDDAIDIMDFGVSVAAKQEERRRIEEEIERYRKEIKSAKSSFQQESKKEATLKRDRDNAAKELRDMMREVRDELESSHTYAGLLKSMRSTVVQSIVIPATSGTTTTHPITPNNGRDLNGRGNEENQVNYSDTTASVQGTLSSILARLQEDRDAKTNKLRNLSKARDESRILFDEVQYLKKAQKERGLVEEVEKSKKETERKAAEVGRVQEQQRNLTLEVESIRNRAAAKAKELGDMGKQCNDLKNKIAAEEADRTKHLASSNLEITDLQKEEAALDAMLADLDAKKEQAQGQLTLFGSFVESREANNAKKAAGEQEKRQLVEKIQAVGKLLVDLEDETEASLRRLDGAKKSKDASDKLRVANDEMEKGDLASAKNEMARLVAKKHEIVTKMSRDHETMEKDQSKEQDEVKYKAAIKKDLEDKIESTRTKLEAGLKEKDTTSKAQQEFRSDTERRIAEHKEREKNFREACSSTEESLKAAQQAARIEWEKQQADLSYEIERERQAKVRYEVILRTGASLIDGMHTAEAQAATEM